MIYYLQEKGDNLPCCVGCKYNPACGQVFCGVRTEWFSDWEIDIDIPDKYVVWRSKE